MTIVFGVTPPIAPTSATSVASAPPTSSNQHGLVNFTARRRSPNSTAPTPPRSTVADWGEDNVAERSREKRLKERLRRWEKGGDSTLLEDLPTLSARPDESEGENGHRGVVVVGGGPSPVPPMLESLIAQRMMNASGASEGGEVATPFFRASVLVPGVRMQMNEQLCRMNRRRDINELAMRMGVGAVGGVLEPAGEEVEEGDCLQGGMEGIQENIWDDWSNHLEAWTNIRQIADRALGSVVSSSGLPQRKKLGLEPTPVPWAAVRRAWAAQRSSRDLRKSFMRESGIVKQKDVDEEHDSVQGVEGEEAEGEEKVDEVVERVRQDPDLEQHEQRLLSCIVDPGECRIIHVYAIYSLWWSSFIINDVQPSASSRAYHRRCPHDCLPASTPPCSIPARYSQGAWHDWMPSLRATRYRQNACRPCPCKRSRLSDADHLALRRHGHGTFSPSPSRNSVTQPLTLVRRRR